MAQLLSHPHLTSSFAKACVYLLDELLKGDSLDHCDEPIGARAFAHSMAKWHREHDLDYDWTHLPFGSRAEQLYNTMLNGGTL